MANGMGGRFKVRAVEFKGERALAFASDGTKSGHSRNRVGTRQVLGS
jgi:hypothetical protein